MDLQLLPRCGWPTSVTEPVSPWLPTPAYSLPEIKFLPLTSESDTPTTSPCRVAVVGFLQAIGGSLIFKAMFLFCIYDPSWPFDFTYFSNLPFPLVKTVCHWLKSNLRFRKSGIPIRSALLILWLSNQLGTPWDRRKVCNCNSDKFYFSAKDFELRYLVLFRGGIP